MSSTTQAILFGAIGTLVETSDMQRRSFNAAFRDAGLDWEWGREAYADMVQAPGGRARIAAYAKKLEVEVDADRIHDAKVAHFRAMAEMDGLIPRPGVMDVIERAKAADVRLGFATTTGTETVDLIFAALSDHIDRADFAFVGDRDLVTQSKPSPEIYRVALQHLGLSTADAIAIEDTPESAQAAVAAKLACVGFPGALSRGRIFPDGVIHVVDHLEPAFCGLDQPPASGRLTGLDPHD